MAFFGRSRRNKQAVMEKPVANDYGVAPGMLSQGQIKRATRARRTWSIITALCLFIAVIFLIMVEIGNTYNKPVLRKIWFIKLNLSNVIPESVPEASLLNSVAQTIGLYDYYQVGLWNYCEGYSSSNPSACTKPHTLYWFNPVEIIMSQLLAGATIALPAELTNILSLIRVASHWMFGLFLTGACLSFVLIPFVLLATKSRWISFFLMFITFVNALCTIAASVIATAMFIIMRNVFRNNADTVNIVATVGTTMFALMWVASAFTLFAFLIELFQTCCCASKRDVRKGKKRGSKKAYETSYAA